MTDSDDEYELPSLAERIQATFKHQSMVKSNKTSDSEKEGTEFLKFSERIHDTPYSQVKCKLHLSSDSENEESKFLKFSERIRNTPASQFGLLNRKASDSENEDTEFLKFSERIQGTSYSQVKCKLHLSSDSENEESEFLKFSERIRSTPVSQFGLKNFHETDDTHCDEVFSNLSEKLQGIQMPNSENEKHHLEDSDSDSDATFENFIAKIQTPKSQNKFSTVISNSLHSSVSLKSRLTKSAVFSDDSVALEGAGSCSQLTNEKEFASLFPARSDNSSFCRKRKFYTQILFDFFNRKVFNYQLPKDMPVFWDESLFRCAGLTHCRVKKGVYSCSIKLSLKLLTSFDRLQDTLLHEMCHAAVWMINKKNICHGPLWQVWASRCKLILPFIECPARCHTYDVPYRYWYQCTNCKWRKGACRRRNKYHGAVCSKCKTPITMIMNN